MKSFGILTIATGRPSYVRMACGLAASARVNCPGVPLCVLTDEKNRHSSSLACYFDQIICIERKHTLGVLTKIYIDKYSPFDTTIFIDTDSIIYGDVSKLVESFLSAGDFSLIQFGIINRETSSYYATTNVKQTLEYFKLDSFPQVHSGVIVFKRGAFSRRVFDSARNALSHLDNLPLKPFYGSIAADEIFFALAMARLKLVGFPDSKNSPFLWVVQDRDRGLQSVDVKKGKALLAKLPGPLSSPAILHFHHYKRNFFTYRRELFSLLGVFKLYYYPIVFVAAAIEWAWLLFARVGKRVASRSKFIRRIVFPDRPRCDVARALDGVKVSAHPWSPTDGLPAADPLRSPEAEERLAAGGAARQPAVGSRVTSRMSRSM